VARFDLDGNQVWFQEFQFADGTATPRDPLPSARLLVGSDDNPLAFFTATNNSPSMLKLKKSDGTPMRWN
jgi:hypothetical protein